MQNVKIITDNGQVQIYVDGHLIKGIHSFSIDYIEGEPLMLSCVADIGDFADGTRLLH